MINTWVHSIYTIIDNSEATNQEEKRKLLKNKYYAEHHHWYLANYFLNGKEKEVIIIIHKENQESFDKQEILKAISKQEKVVVETIQLKKFW